MADSVLGLVAKLAKAVETIPKANEKATAAAAMEGKRILEAGAVAARVPRATHGKARRNWSANYRIRPTPANGTSAADIFYKGAAPYWVNFGTKPHLIARRGSGSRKTLAKKGLGLQIVKALGGLGGGTGQFKGPVRVPGGRGFAQYVHHPGAHARPFWEPTKQEVARVVPKIYEQANRDALLAAGFGS